MFRLLILILTTVSSFHLYGDCSIDKIQGGGVQGNWTRTSYGSWNSNVKERQITSNKKILGQYKDQYQAQSALKLLESLKLCSSNNMNCTISKHYTRPGYLFDYIVSTNDDITGKYYSIDELIHIIGYRSS
jgi:hypothetical protein